MAAADKDDNLHVAKDNYKVFGFDKHEEWAVSEYVVHHLPL